MASDAIYQDLLKVQQAGKPVVVSMGNLAASGGYYISGFHFLFLTHPSAVTHPVHLLVRSSTLKQVLIVRHWQFQWSVAVLC